MARVLHDFDLKSFWEDSKVARKDYVEQKPTAAQIASVEKALGFRLPASYVELMKVQNGGIPRNTCFPTKKPTSWAKDHVAISAIAGIGRTKKYSLCGKLGSKFMQEEWGYPKIGICICNCPSAGHDIIMLDYRKCGKEGEPHIVHVDQERDYKITILAQDFETFIRGLVNESVFDTSSADLKECQNTIEKGAFSPFLAELISKRRDLDFGPIIRNICRSLAKEKGYFGLHADDKSYLLYDIQFFLYSNSYPVRAEQAYLDEYPDMIALCGGEFTTGGYAPEFITDWLEKRRSAGDIVTNSAGRLTLSKEFAKTLKARCKEYR
jgi:hypothetical protein